MNDEIKKTDQLEQTEQTTQTTQTEQKVTHSWRDALPEGLRNHEYVIKYNKPADVVKDLIELKNRYTEIENNIPKKPEEIELQEAENIDKEILAEYKKFVYENKIPKTEAKKLYEWYNEKIKNKIESQNKFIEERNIQAIENLKKEWKTDFEKNQLLASNAFKKLADEEAISFVNNTMVDGVLLGNHPVFLKIFKKIGDLISDDSALIKESKKGGISDDEAKASLLFPSMRKK